MYVPSIYVYLFFYHLTCFKGNYTNDYCGACRNGYREFAYGKHHGVRIYRWALTCKTNFQSLSIKVNNSLVVGNMSAQSIIDLRTFQSPWRWHFMRVLLYYYIHFQVMSVIFHSLLLLLFSLRYAWPERNTHNCLEPSNANNRTCHWQVSERYWQCGLILSNNTPYFILILSSDMTSITYQIRPQTFRRQKTKKQGP